MEPIYVGDTTIAKSDQLNTDDLTGGPITVQITGITRSDSVEQPVIVAISGGHRPWKPCKTERRVLCFAWGDDAAKWIGRWLKLYRDNAVTWAGVAVGGIRIGAMSDTGALSISLATTKGKKATRKVEAMMTAPTNTATAKPRPVDTLLAAMAKNLVLEADDLAAWALSAGIDVSTLTREGQDALWKGLRPGGTERADFDAWLHGDRAGGVLARVGTDAVGDAQSIPP